MQNNPVAFQDAVARAREIAQKLGASGPNALKRPNSDDDYSNKRPAFTPAGQPSDIPASVLRAQQVAQQINSQLGVKSTGDPSLPLSNQFTCQEDYKIPDKFVGLVIGKGGEQIVRIQQESGCKVQISQMRPDASSGGANPPDRLANLSGSREAIDRAKRIIDDIVYKGRSADGGPGGSNPYSLGGANSKSVELMMPSAKCGLVIGKGGETIKRLSEEFAVKMLVIQEISEIDGIEHKPLRITGDADRVERAKQYVLESILKSGGPHSGNRSGGNQGGSGSFNDYGSRTGGAPVTGPCNEAVYHVPFDRAGIIIGKGGENIKEINRKSGAFVELDKSHGPPMGGGAERIFKLRGTPDQIVRAQQLMFEKVANTQSGTGDMLTPILFQQQFNLPLVGSGSADGWNGNNDPYGNGANNNDPYSQWSNAFGQWPQMNPYDPSSATANSDASGANGASAMAGMDPAWLAYYQSMSYYNMMQSNMAGSTSSGTTTGTTTTKPTDSTASTGDTSSTTAATNSATGQADYSQQWIEYYRSMGQNEYADEIARQTKQSSTTTTTSSSTPSAAEAAQATAMMMSGNTNSWAAYAQQWANAAMANSTNGNTSSNVPTS